MKKLFCLLLPLALALVLLACEQQSPGKENKARVLVAKNEGIERFVPSKEQEELLTAYQMEENPIFLFQAPSGANWLQVQVHSYHKGGAWVTEDLVGLGIAPEAGVASGYFSLTKTGFSTWLFYTSGGSSIIRPSSIPADDATAPMGYLLSYLQADSKIALDTPIPIAVFLASKASLPEADPYSVFAAPAQYEDCDYVCLLTVTFQEHEMPRE